MDINREAAWKATIAQCIDSVDYNPYCGAQENLVFSDVVQYPEPLDCDEIRSVVGSMDSFTYDAHIDSEQWMTCEYCKNINQVKDRCCMFCGAPINIKE